MGTYLGVTAVQRNGQPVQLYTGSTQPTVPQGKRLIAIMDNGVWKIAPDVTRPSEYAEFHRNYSQGNWLAMKLYLLDESKVAECPDEG